MRTSRLMGYGAAAVVACVALAVPPASATPSTGTAAVLGSAGPAVGPNDDEVLRAALNAVVDAGATGAIGLVDDGTDVSTVAVGAARLDPRRPLRVRDQLRVGSITKTVIATITLQLVGEGRLRLGDTVERWLPGMVPNGSAITVRMLLNHTSGIFDYVQDPDWTAAVAVDPYRSWSPQELVAVATAHPPLFAPGQGAAYSNTGYILLGLVLEKATGQPVQELVRQRVARPLHLHSTFFATSARFRGPYAHGYFPPSLTGGGYLDTSSWHPSLGGTAGALVSTAPELARFYQALLSGRLLSPALLQAMTTTVTDPAYPGLGSGLGIFSMETPCGTVWGHEGGIPGYKSFAVNDRSGSRSAVVLVPTELDEAIGAAFYAAVATAVCQMLDRDPALASHSAAPTTATRPLPAGPAASSRLRLVG
jgi:D-alanyl-D-alanine carboxypeptidase